MHPCRRVHDVRQTRHLGRFGQLGTGPRFVQHVSIVKLQPVQIVLECAPRQMLQNLREIIGQLIFAQIIDVIVEMFACPAHAVTVRFYRLGLYTAQLQTFEQAAVISGKRLWELVVGTRVS